MIRPALPEHLLVQDEEGDRAAAAGVEAARKLKKAAKRTIKKGNTDVPPSPFYSQQQISLGSVCSRAALWHASEVSYRSYVRGQ